MFGFLKRDKQLLDEASIRWLFASYGFFLENFDAGFFYNSTTLLTPSNKHFPGRAESAEAMSRLIFDAVRGYAGMSHWPCHLVDHQQFDPQQQEVVEISGPPRQLQAPQHDVSPALLVPFDPMLVKNPQALIASYAHILAYHLIRHAPRPTPGGEENLPHLAEVLGVFLGFGLMLANTAYSFKRGGCGGCAVSDRHNYLSQYDLTYALAIFTHLKSIPRRQVTRDLKKSLIPFFKQALQDVAQRKALLAGLPQTGVAQPGTS